MMKNRPIERVYRLVYSDENNEYTDSPFFLAKDEALEYLEKVKEAVRVLYEDDDGICLGGTIELQTIDLNEVEDIDFYADSREISKWVVDEEATRERYLELVECCGIVCHDEIGMWEDKRMNSKINSKFKMIEAYEKDGLIYKIDSNGKLHVFEANGITIGLDMELNDGTKGTAFQLKADGVKNIDILEKMEDIIDKATEMFFEKGGDSVE